jgi:Predicted membrane protein (DUF2243)
MPAPSPDQGRRGSASGPEGLSCCIAGSLRQARTQPAIRASIGARVADKCRGIHPAWLPRAADLCHAAGTSLAGEWQAKTSPAYVGARGSLNLYDGIIQHKLLGLHQVRAGGAQQPSLRPGVHRRGRRGAADRVAPAPGGRFAESSPGRTRSSLRKVMSMGMKLGGAVVVVAGASAASAGQPGLRSLSEGHEW